jgi:FXSXX-COOH protein
MSEDSHDDALIDVSELTLRQLANEVDKSSLAKALYRLLDSNDEDSGGIAGFNACI